MKRNIPLCSQYPKIRRIFSMSRLLLIFDQDNFKNIKNRKKLYLKYSHDLNIAQLGQAALDEGATVYLTAPSELYESGYAWRVESFYPAVSFSDCSERADTVSPDCVASAAAESLVCKDKFPNAKLVAFFAAVHLIESPGLHSETWLYDVAVALRLHIDYIVTQNNRMAQLVNLQANLSAGVDLKDRIFTCPLGVWENKKTATNIKLAKLREKYLCKDKIVFGNAGGIWRWTDYKVFLLAFIKAIRTGHLNIKLYITGLTHENSVDHSDHTHSIRSILNENLDLVSSTSISSKPIIFVDEWEAGGNLLGEILPMLDVGLNLNKRTLEGWQSYRARMLDYIQHGVVVLSTQHHDHVTNSFGSPAIKVEAESFTSYYDAIIKISAGEIDLGVYRNNAINLINKTHYKKRFSELYYGLIEGSNRGDKEPEYLEPCLFDVVRLEANRTARDRLIDSATSLLSDRKK